MHTLTASVNHMRVDIVLILSIRVCVSVCIVPAYS